MSIKIDEETGMILSPMVESIFPVEYDVLLKQLKNKIPDLGKYYIDAGDNLHLYFSPSIMKDYPDFENYIETYQWYVNMVKKDHITVVPFDYPYFRKEDSKRDRFKQNIISDSLYHITDKSPDIISVTGLRAKAQPDFSRFEKHSGRCYLISEFMCKYNGIKSSTIIMQLIKKFHDLYKKNLYYVYEIDLSYLKNNETKIFNDLSMYSYGCYIQHNIPPEHITLLSKVPIK